MLINVGYDITIEVQNDTPTHVLAGVHQSRNRDLIFEDPLVVPNVPIMRSADLYGNAIDRFVAPAGVTHLSYRAVVRDSGVEEPHPLNAREVPIGELPDECLPYLSASRYCETDELAPLAWQLFGHTLPGYARVQAICDYTHKHLQFDYQRARSTRTARDAYNEGTGVCRDFAHLAIAFCRSMNIPARYINGYLGDIGIPADPAPMDFSAWFEAYIGDQWVTFDARHNTPRIGRVVIARGRDAADVPMITSFGPHTLVAFHVVAEEIAPTPAYEPAEIRPHPAEQMKAA